MTTRTCTPRRRRASRQVGSIIHLIMHMLHCNIAFNTRSHVVSAARWSSAARREASGGPAAEARIARPSSEMARPCAICLGSLLEGREDEDEVDDSQPGLAASGEEKAEGGRPYARVVHEGDTVHVGDTFQTVGISCGALEDENLAHELVSEDDQDHHHEDGDERSSRSVRVSTTGEEERGRRNDEVEVAARGRGRPRADASLQHFSLLAARVCSTSSTRRPISCIEFVRRRTRGEAILSSRAQTKTKRKQHTGGVLPPAGSSPPEPEDDELPGGTRPSEENTLGRRCCTRIREGDHCFHQDCIENWIVRECPKRSLLMGDVDEMERGGKGATCPLCKPKRSIVGLEIFEPAEHYNYPDEADFSSSSGSGGQGLRDVFGRFQQRTRGAPKLKRRFVYVGEIIEDHDKMNTAGSGTGRGSRDTNFTRLLSLRTISVALGVRLIWRNGRDLKNWFEPDDRVGQAHHSSSLYDPALDEQVTACVNEKLLPYFVPPPPSSREWSSSYLFDRSSATLQPHDAVSSPWLNESMEDHGAPATFCSPPPRGPTDDWMRMRMQEVGAPGVDEEDARPQHRTRLPSRPSTLRQWPLQLDWGLWERFRVAGDSPVAPSVSSGNKGDMLRGAFTELGLPTDEAYFVRSSSWRTALFVLDGRCDSFLLACGYGFGRPRRAEKVPCGTAVEHMEEAEQEKLKRKFRVENVEPRFVIGECISQILDAHDRGVPEVASDSEPRGRRDGKKSIGRGICTAGP